MTLRQLFRELFMRPSEALLLSGTDPLLEELNREWETRKPPKPRLFDLTVRRDGRGAITSGGLSLIPFLTRWKERA